MASRVSFALTSQDVQMLPPQSRGSRLPTWLAKPPDAVAVVRLFGVTQQGASVCAHIHGFRPFFFAELSPDALQALVAKDDRLLGVMEERELPDSESIELAAALEAAAGKAGRSHCRVLGLRLVFRRPAYGLHLTRSPFLQIEVSDPRDVDPLAAAVQSGEVPKLGRAQAFEAHLPFILQFLAHHHLSGAGQVRVVGDLRGSSAQAEPETSCKLELDVSAPDGVLNYVDYASSLSSAGDCAEARALVAARAMFDWGSGSTPAGAGGAEAAGRPTAGARTTPTEVREAVKRWLCGGSPPVSEARAAHAADAAAFALAHNARSDVADIEDLVRVPPGSSSSRRKPRAARPPARYSDPLDDPRRHSAANGSNAPLGFGRGKAAVAKDSQPSPGAPTEGTSVCTGATPALAEANPIEEKEMQEEPPPLLAGGALPSSKSTTAATASAQQMEQSAKSSIQHLGSEPAWEEVCAVLSLEVLCKGGDCRSATTSEIAVVAFTLRPHACQLGGKQLRPGDRRGAFALSSTSKEGADSQVTAELAAKNFSVCWAATEWELLERLGAFIQDVDPDVCLGWEVRSKSWGFLVARAQALAHGSFLAKLSRVYSSKVSYSEATRLKSKSTAGSGKTMLATEGSAEDPSAAAAVAAGARWRERGGEAKDPSTYDSELIAPGDLQFAGRLLLNVWRVLMHLTFGARLRGYGLHEVAIDLLDRTVPYISPSELAWLWRSNDGCKRIAVLQHIQVLAALSLHTLDHLEVLPRAGELSRLFGMDLLSGFTRGTQLRVESVLLRVAHAAGMVLLSASQAQVRNQPALECLPLVMEPHSGIYWDPVLVLDFKGMYPSLIVAHNLSFDTCLGRVRNSSEGRYCRLGVRLDEPWQLDEEECASIADSFTTEVLQNQSEDCPVRLQPGGCLFASPTVRKGLLPLMLAEVLRLRAAAKAAMKVSTPAVASRLNQRQFALKFFANVTYGYAGASFSGRMPCAEVADAIVATGRRALEEAAAFIETAEPDAKVIYGDTDSVFVQLRGASIEEAFATGRRLCKEISALHPLPVELEFEKVYMPCVCLTKKRYGGMAYTRPPSEGGKPQFEAKGLEAVRRDQCKLGSDLQRDILHELFRTEDISAVKRMFISKAEALLRGKLVDGPPLCDLVFRRELRLGTYRAEDQDGGGGATLPPQAVVAYERMEAEGEAAAPQFGERVSYVVACGMAGARLVDRCVEPTAVAEGCKDSINSVDRWWYVEKAMLPVVARVFFEGAVGLPPVDCTAWLRKVPRPSAIKANANGSRGLLDHMLRKVCSSCRTREAVGSFGCCSTCAPQTVRDEAVATAEVLRLQCEELTDRCRGCAGSTLWSSCRGASHCPNFSRRLLAENDFEAALVQSRQLLGGQVQAAAAALRDKVEDTYMIVSDDEMSVEAGNASKAELPPACDIKPTQLDRESESEEGEQELHSHSVGGKKAVEPAADFPMVQKCQTSPSLLEEIQNFVVDVSDDETHEHQPVNENMSANGPAALVTAAVVSAETGSAAAAADAAGASVPPPNCPGHGEPCREIEVRKEGPNQGRKFFACARPREEQCKFFAWADGSASVKKARAPLANSDQANGAATAAADGTSNQITPQRKRKDTGSTSTPAGKRQRRQSQQKDGRLERFVPKASKKVVERIDRALEHRLFLIQAEEGPKGQVQAAVLGHTGNVYTVTLGQRVQCTCQDFARTNGPCKHLLFIMLRVLKVPRDDARLWQKALVPNEVQDLRERLDGWRNSTLPSSTSEIASAVAGGAAAEHPTVTLQASAAVVAAFETAVCDTDGKRRVRAALGEECPVCIDRVDELASAVFCLSCGKNLHRECLQQWRGACMASSSLCPCCRATWEEPPAKLAPVQPGQALPKTLNLAAFSGHHVQPMSVEETYPDTHQWIQRRETAAASSSGSSNVAAAVEAQPLPLPAA